MTRKSFHKGRSAALNHEIERVISIIVEHTKVKRTSLLFMENRGPERISTARQLLMYLLHTRIGLTITEVGLVLQRDRTTVRHACALIEDARDGAEFDGILWRLEQAIFPDTILYSTTYLRAHA